MNDNINKIQKILQNKVGYQGSSADLMKYLETPENKEKLVKILNTKVGYEGTVDDFNSYVGIQVPKVEGIQKVSAPSITVGAPEVNVMSPLASNMPTTPKVDWAAKEEGSITKPIAGELEREQPVNFEGMTPDPKNNPDYSVTNQSGKFVYTFDKEKSDRRKEKDAYLTILDEQMKESNKRLEESMAAVKKYNAENPTSGWENFPVAYGGAAFAKHEIEKQKITGGEPQGEIFATQAILKDAEQAFKAPKKGENWAKSFGIGGAETVTDPDAWLFGILSLNEVQQSMHVFEKVEKGEPLNATESALMDAMLTRTQAEAMRSSDTSNWYKGGKIAGEALPFMRDMAMTGGLNTITAAAGKGSVKLAQRATAKYLRKKAEKQLLKEGVDITEDILSRRAADLFMRTAKVADYSGRLAADLTITPALKTPLQPTAYAEMGRNMQGHVVGNEFGTYQIEKGDDIGVAAAKTFMSRQSEGVGTYFNPALKGLKFVGGKLIPKVISNTKLGQLGGKMVDFIIQDNSTLQKAGVSGYFGENLEEVYESAANYVLGLSTKEELKSFYTSDNLKSMFIGTAPMSALGISGNAINYGSNEVLYRMAKKELGGITDELDNTSVGELGNKMLEVLVRNNAFDEKGNLTKEGKVLHKNMLSYAQRKMAKDIANDGKQENPNSKYYDFLLNERSKKWLESYLADNDLTAPMYFNLAYKATLHENELTDYERKTLSELDRAFNGYLKAEDAAQQANAEIDTQVNPTNNKIQNVMVGGQPHMVKGGNIVMTENEEGKVILDKENSDQVITVVNAEGIPSQIGIEQLESVVGEVDAEEAKNAAIESAHTTAYNETFYPVGSIVYRKDAQGQFSAIKETGADGFIINSVTEGGEAVPTLIENTNSENFGVISLKAGDKYTLNDGTQLDIISNEDGVISASVNGQPSEQTTADELATLFESTGIDLTQFEPSEEAVTETEVQEQQQAVETQQVEETQQVQETEASEVYPTDKKGEPIFEQMPVEQSIKVVREVLGDDAVNFVEDRLKAANKAVKAVAKKAPKSTSLLGRKAEVEAIALEKQKATESLDYWTNVKRLMSEEAIQATREQAPTNQVVENPNQVGQVIIDRYESAKKVIGNSATITAPNGKVLKGRYVLVSAYAVTPSHNPFDGYNSSEGFPLNADGSNANQRDYKNDKANQVVTDGIAKVFGGQALENVPKVSKRGVVLDHNGTTMASQLAAANGTDKAYLEALNNNAANYGFTAADLKSISNPRIVFELETELPYTTEAFAMFNSEEKKSESATASAVAKSKQLSPSSVAKIAALVDSYSSLESFFSSETATAEMVKTLVDAKVINTLEIAKLIDNGLFSATGRELITNVLLGATLNEQAIRQIGNDSSLKGIIVRAMKQILENAKLKEYSLFEDINNAISLMYEARKAKMTVSEFLLQTNMFEKGASERFSDFEQMLALAMSDSGVLFKGTIDKYNTVAAPLVGGQVDMFTGRILDPNEVKQQIIEYYGKTKSIINPNAGVDGRNRGSETTGTGSGRISLESAQAMFDAATTTEEKYKAALEITLILDEQNNTTTIVAKDDEDFISMLPSKWAEKIRKERVAGVFFEGQVIVNAEKVLTGGELTLVYEHEYAHNANRNVHSSEELEELWNNSTDKKILPRVYLGFADNVKGDELIAHIIEDIIQKQGYENYKNGNIDLSLYSQQEQLKKTIDYANKEYLRNVRGGNSRGNLYEDNNARKADENLQQTDEGRQTPRFRRKDGGELTEVKRNVQGDVSQGGSRVRQAVTTETLLIDGVERPTRNSNGAYIHSTEEGVRNFYAWFGNSKVTDEQGRPLVVYHFGKFGSDGNYESKGRIHLGTYQAALDRQDLLKRWTGKSDGEIKPYYLKISNPKHTKDVGNDRNWSGEEFVATKNGNDGLFYENKYEEKGSVSYVVWQPTQIKSATDNTGEFSENNADIRFKIAKSQEELDNFVKDSKVKKDVYHATSAEFDEFDISKSANGTIWFSTDKESTLDKQQSGKEATRIIEAKINLKNPAGWDEYEKYSIDELIREGYDGAILDEDAFVFSPEQVLISPTNNNTEFSENSDDIRFKMAYHGSPNNFEKFSLDHIGTGEGAQAFGWGLYFTDKKGIAEQYAKSLGQGNLKQQYQGIDVEPQSPLDSAAGIINDYQKRYNTIPKAIKRAEELKGYVEKDNPVMMKYWNDVIDWLRHSKISDFKRVPNRNLYTVKIHGDKSIDELNFLRWDKPVGDKINNINFDDFIGEYYQPTKAYGNYKKITDKNELTQMDGNSFYAMLSQKLGSDKAASLFLLDNGIDGIQYPTEYTSKGAHEGDFNYVVFDENVIEIEDHIRFKIQDEKSQTTTDIPEIKQKQLEIITAQNPMLDNYHTGIRTVSDIKTLQETIDDKEWSEYEYFNPDYTKSMAQKAIETGKITVYSSYPIKQGEFVSPSKMEAESYSGNGKVYSKEVNISDIAWIDPTQGQFASVLDDPRFSIKSPIGFYSTVENALDKIQQEKGTKEQFQKMLLNNGAKQAEMDWMGFDELPEKLTKADIQNWIDENRIEVEEVQKGNYSNRNLEAVKVEPFVYNVVDTKNGEVVLSNVSQSRADEFIDNAHDGTNTKFSQYVLPGGENYKELLLTMPNNKAYKNELNRIAKKYGVEANYISIRESKATDDELAEIRRLDTKPTNFKSAHFDEPNILAHVRFDERTVNGERVLFIEEFQSDWAQKGKKEGFIDNSEYEAIPDGENRWDVGGIKVLYFEKGIDGKNYRTINKRHEQLWFPTLQEAVREASSTAKDRFRDREIGKVPDMPFRKTDQWLNLAARRMMRYAAENGFDRIAWTTGTQQSERYDLSKQVDKINYVKLDNGKYGIDFVEKGKEIFTKAGEYDENQLDDIVGKEIAKKIINGEGKNIKGENLKSLTGVDLKVGGEGMKAFYDAIVPSAMNKLGKPFGAKVENISMPLETSNDFEIETELYADGTGVAVINNTGDRIAEFDTEREANDFILSKTSSTQQSIPVTESMKETVMEGIPLFKISGEQKETKLPDTIDVDGTQRPTTNSNGKQIHSTEEGTRNFWRWFGDSKVVDEQGRPLVVYHGTNADFSEFGKTSTGMNFLTSSKEVALGYGKNIKETYLGIKNPEIVDMSGYNWFGQRVVDRGIGLPESINKGRKTNYVYLESLKAKRAGYDGIIFKNVADSNTITGGKAVGDTYVVFDNTKIKSATGNDGSFGADNADIRFSIKAPKFESGASLKEMVTTSNMFIAARVDKYGAKGRRMVESEIKTVGRAISEQTANLKESANLVTGMVKALLNNGSMNNMTRAELSQILTNVRNASNKKDLTKEFDKISSIVRQIQLRNAKRRFNDLMKFKVQNKNAKGISIASTVDDETVSIITTIRKSLKELTLEDVENQINEINNLDKKTTSDETKLVGLGIARDYMNEIKTREAQLSELSEELSKAKDDLVGKEGKNRLTGTQLVNSIEVQISQVKSEMTSAYDDLSARLNKIIAEGKEALKNIKLQDKERVATISHFVNSDMKGIEPKNNPEKGRTFKQWLKSNLIISPLQSFDFILRSLAPNQVAGNGYLHDHFSRGILSASQNAYEGTESAFKMLDEAVAKIFGNKFTFRYISARDFKKMSKYELTYGTEKSSTTITATNGQLAYVYAVNKMTDGAMKLRAMGISEEQVEEMKAALPVRIVKLVDVIQDEILPKLRVKYNNAHLEIFNTSMASIENYFPLHIDKTALTQKVDLEEESNKLSGLIKNSTKSIIKRTVNTKPIDIRNSDFSDILTDHIKDMEQWAAFASIRRDMNTLLSNRNFLNRLIELGGFEYMVQFKRAAAIAVDVYQPFSDSYDKVITGVARNFATSKVVLNPYTALKQVLSIVAYLTEPSPKFQGKVLVNIAKGHASFKWAMDNLPDFRKRWVSSALGDEKLSRQFANIASEGDFVKFMDASQKVVQKYGMYPNKMVDSYICSVGAKALYETNYDKYIAMGATEEKARERALVDAVNLYNTTQQSSESMFLSGVQLDRTFFSTAYTVFNNASLAYNRHVFDAARNLKNAFNNRANLIENRTKFNMRTFNVSEEASKKAATKEVDIQIMRDVLRLAVFGYGVQFVWRLGSQFPYLLFGDDDDKKKKIVKEAATGGALITPVRGLLFGATFEAVIDGLMDWLNTGNSYAFVNRLTGNIHPIISDVDQLARAAVSKTMTSAKAGYLLLNLGAKLGWGIDLKPFANFTYGFVELMDSDELTANDVLIDIMSMLSVPQSQLEALALDNPETFFDRYIELKELVDYGLLAPVLELNPDDLNNYIKSGRRYMSREMKEKVEK